MANSKSAEIAYLLSLQAVRERSQLVLQAAKEGSLNSFDYDEPRMTDVAKYVIDIIKRDFGPDRYAEIPPHGRWQHFNVGGVDRIGALLEQWSAEGQDKLEQTRRLIDLFFVSVLVDAGVGDKWKFKEPGSDRVYSRSEGTAVASLYMFKSGAFSSNPEQPHSVDGRTLHEHLTEEHFNESFQITSENPMIGVASRVNLLKAAGKQLVNYDSRVFKESSRPGQMVDWFVQTSKEPNTLDYAELWNILQGVLIPAWPKERTHISGQPIGDAWPLKVLADRSASSSSGGNESKSSNKDETAAIAPFHKLTQWLGYSLTVPFVRVLGWKLANDGLGTGLPEYRNGGLFYDLGALRLKPEVLEAGRKAAAGGDLPLYPATGDTIVEWRAMTVALLDELHGLVAAHFEKEGVKLSVAQVLEAGSWLGGRELASKLRPETKSSPILFEGDGTLF